MQDYIKEKYDSAQGTMRFNFSSVACLLTLRKEPLAMNNADTAKQRFSELFNSITELGASAEQIQSDLVAVNELVAGSYGREAREVKDLFYFKTALVTMLRNGRLNKDLLKLFIANGLETFDDHLPMYLDMDADFELDVAILMAESLSNHHKMIVYGSYFMQPAQKNEQKQQSRKECKVFGLC